MELADFFGVTIATICNWGNRHLEFFNALRRGKDFADERVERALYSKAMGYTYDTEKIVVASGKVVRVPICEHVPPSDKAIQFWLTNRQPLDWRFRVQTDFDPDRPINIKVTGGFNPANRPYELE